MNYLSRQGVYSYLFVGRNLRSVIGEQEPVRPGGEAALAGRILSGGAG
ncbi:hypothetical protein NB311A_15987 [Nitrobacter sp. Nb-311A]|nr:MULTISPECIES: hypothetical protein [unclassified Nitrobacter]EAQ36783.1 hypothetical protein NB311A_15987 [Nitrobacter sp. Nb-311A]MCV0385468.1 hypothetical protein [Nitrobacter sp.]